MARLKKEVELTEKRLLAIVSGMKIFSDSVYVVTGKMDVGAPDGFQERGISKVPFPGNKTIASCPWDKNLHVYDTGFFPSSICYRGWTKSEVGEELKRRIANIKEPYEDATGNDLDQRNFDFWDSLTIPDYEGRLFYTNDINDLFELYVSLQGRTLTPKELDGDPMFHNSLYCVEDKTTAVDIKKQRQLDKTEIIYNFMTMLNGNELDQQQIKDLLLYLGIIRTVNMEPEMMRYAFLNWIEQRSTNVDQYKEAYNRYMSEDQDADGPQTLKFYRMISELIFSGGVQVTSSGVFVDGMEMGADTFSSAQNMVKGKEYVPVKAKLVEAYSAYKDKQEKRISRGNQ